MATRTPEMSFEDEIPLPSSQPLEVDFIHHKVTEYQDVNGRLPATYDANKQRFVERTRRFTFRSESETNPLDLSAEDIQDNELAFVSTTKSFDQAIGELKKSKGKKAEIASFPSLRECHDWDDVSRALQRVVEVYEDSDSVSGRIRTAFKRVGNHSKSIESFVGLLPDGNYKTLCGGLTLILKAMGRHAEVREAIAELVDELPEFVRDCEDYVALYPGKNMLRVRVNQLYVELLSALEEIVRWYTQPSRKRIVGSLLHNSTYGQAIHRRVDNIQKCRTRFHAEAAKFQHYKLQAIDETGLETNAIVHRMDQDVGNLQRSLNDCSVDAKRRDSMVCRRMSEATSALNGIKDVLTDNVKNAKWHGAINRLVQRLLDEEEKRKEELEEKSKMIESKDSEIAKIKFQADASAQLVNQLSQTPQSLAARLSLSPSTSALHSDLAHIQGTGLNQSVSFQNRSRWVAESSEFKKWLSSSKSGMLLVQGNTDLETVSPLTFLMALLQEKLAPQGRVMALPVFCGLQDSNIDDDAAEISRPNKMLRDLLTQLLERKDVNWEHGDGGHPYLAFLSRNSISQLECGSYKTYLSTIARLISILQRRFDSIFVMIDGLDFLDEAKYDEVRRLLKYLMKLVKARDPRDTGEVAGPIKVLCTVSTHLDYCPSGKGLAVLDMSEDLDEDEDGLEELSTEN